MASGYEVGGTDLDSILAPYHSGWPQAIAVGYSVAGANLNARYAPLSSGTAAAATGYKNASADLNTVFAALGSTGVTVGTQPSNVTGSRAAGFPSGVVTSAAASCAGAKGKGTYTYTWHVTGCTATSPSAASSTFFATVNAASIDHASAFCTISDGVTSVNTSTISVTLQNTSPAVAVFPTSVASSSTLPQAATSTIEFNTSGQEVAFSNSNPGGTVIGDWLPGGGTSGYQVKATLSSGTAPQESGSTNTLGVWIPVTTGLTWGLEQTLAGTISCSLLFEISNNSSTVLASGTISLSASASH